MPLPLPTSPHLSRSIHPCHPLHCLLLGQTTPNNSLKMSHSFSELIHPLSLVNRRPLTPRDVKSLQKCSRSGNIDGLDYIFENKSKGINI